MIAPATKSRLKTFPKAPGPLERCLAGEADAVGSMEPASLARPTLSTVLGRWLAMPI